MTQPEQAVFTQYRRTQIAEMRPFIDGELLSVRVSISRSDIEAGHPMPGDMIARNPANHDDQWLVAADYFAANFEALASPPPPAAGRVTREEIATKLRQQAQGMRGLHEAWHKKPLVCDTINNALEYGRAQGLEMAADEIDKALALTTEEGTP